VPPAGFLQALRALCDERDLLLILDENYTRFGRTGSMFACEREDVVPDILCVGKAIAGGVPLSATSGTAHVMDAWPVSAGEALHTSTFLGNPLACAAALVNLDEIVRLDLPGRVREREAALGAISRALEAGTLINNVAATFPLAESGAAHEAVEQGKLLGNVVVTI